MVFTSDKKKREQEVGTRREKLDEIFSKHYVKWNVIYVGYHDNLQYSQRILEALERRIQEGVAVDGEVHTLGTQINAFREGIYKSQQMLTALSMRIRLVAMRNLISCQQCPKWIELQVLLRDPLTERCQLCELKYRMQKEEERLKTIVSEPKPVPVLEGIEVQVAV